MSRLTAVVGAVVALALGTLTTTVSGQAKPPATIAKPATRWVMPRTPDGKPDLQGNWTNETQTPLERMTGGGSTLTDDQAQKIEDRAQLVEEYRDKASDPHRAAKGRRGGPARRAGRKIIHRADFRSRRRCGRRLQRLLARSGFESDS